MRRQRALLLFLVLGLAAGCSDLGEPLAPPPAPDDEEPPVPVAFAAEVLPLLEANCRFCHAPEMAEYANLVGVPAGGYGGALRVAAGDTTASVLYQKIRGNPLFGAQMPPGAVLAPSAIARIGRWIAEGALDN
ncbi:hypothetical protein FJ251_01650 [bacterium]|nr:hypothetical protein [bacterium]